MGSIFEQRVGVPVEAVGEGEETRLVLVVARQAQLWAKAVLGDEPLHLAAAVGEMRVNFGFRQAVRAIYEEQPEVDGFIYSSRLTGDDCVAVFGRAVEKLTVLDACELKDHPELPAVLVKNRIALSEME